MNSNGLSFDPTNVESITINNSIFRNNSTDILDGNTAIASTIYLYDANTITFLSTPGGGQQIKSDGTNNIISISGGGSLTKVSPQ